MAYKIKGKRNKIYLNDNEYKEFKTGNFILFRINYINDDSEIPTEYKNIITDKEAYIL